MKTDKFIEVLTDLDGGEQGENFNVFSSIQTLLDMSDKDFEIISPAILENFLRQINNSNDKLLLVQALHATGNSVEELGESFHNIIEGIEKTNYPKAKKDFVKQIFGGIYNAIYDTEGVAKKIVLIPMEKCHEDAIIPKYANTSDSGMDLYALEDYVIAPGETKLIPTGIKVALPPGYELQVRPKSGRALKTKLRVANTPGTIDAGYRDEIKVIIENIEAPIKDIEYEFDDDGHIKITSILHGTNQYIGKGEKFAQLVLMEVPKAVFYAVDNVGAIEGDRGGGFGSTGLK